MGLILQLQGTSYFDTLVYHKVCELHKLIRCPVRTVVVADMVCKQSRTIRYSLARLESAGYIQRKGQRGGWIPVAAPLHPPRAVA